MIDTTATNFNTSLSYKIYLNVILSMCHKIIYYNKYESTVEGADSSVATSIA